MDYSSFSEISSICKQYNITNYIINNDGSIDVKGDVDLKGKLFWDTFTITPGYGERNNYTLDRIPLKFRNVTGSFDCRFNKIRTLEGCPTSVGGDFFISDNLLESLNGCPREVGRFLAGNNLFENLEGSPKIVRGDFNVSGEYSKVGKLRSLKGGPISVGGYYSFANNPMFDVQGFPKNFSSDYYSMKQQKKTIIHLVSEDIEFARTSFSEVLNLLYKCEHCDDINCNHSKDTELINFLINQINRYKIIDDDTFYVSRFEQMYYDLVDNDDLYLKKIPSKIELKNYKMV